MKLKLFLVILIVIVFIYTSVTVHRANGESMMPTISNGAYIVGLKYTNPTVGNVVVFHKPGGGRPVAHRIIWQGEGRLTNTEKGMFYRTQGDNNDIEDRYLISEKDIISRSIFVLVF